MIFLTIGTQEPFTRLVRAADRWAGETGYADLFAQISEKGAREYTPDNFPWTENLDPADYRRKAEAADILVAHAGMGSIITALSNAKPIVIMPRNAALGEHRNEHQLATVSHFRDKPGIFVADDETRLGEAIERAMESLASGAAPPIGPFADDDLIASLRDFIDRD